MTEVSFIGFALPDCLLVGHCAEPRTRGYPETSPLGVHWPQGSCHAMGRTGAGEHKAVLLPWLLFTTSPNLSCQKYGFPLKPSKLKTQVMDFNKTNCQTTGKWSFKPLCVVFSPLVPPAGCLFLGPEGLNTEHHSRLSQSFSFPWDAPVGHWGSDLFGQVFVGAAAGSFGVIWGSLGALGVLHWRGFFPRLPAPSVRGKLPGGARSSLLRLRASSCARRIKAVGKREN